MYFNNIFIVNSIFIPYYSILNKSNIHTIKSFTNSSYRINEMNKQYSHAILILLIAFVSILSAPVYAEQSKILVVMSYERDNPWCQEIKEGIESVLGDSYQITYFYMDTKINFSHGHKKAEQAYNLYKQVQPDGVIVADDNAQSMFVVPYLKDKVETPVMFCGVNADAKKYGYPSSNVSGTLERGHVRESIAFMKQLIPDLKTVAFVVKNSPSGIALSKQVELEKNTYLAKVNGFYLVNNTTELINTAKQLNGTADAVYIDSIEGIVDENLRPLNAQQFITLLSQTYSGPIIGANQYYIEKGALSAVVKTGQEQGELSAKQLLKTMQGTKLIDIPIEQNYKGKRILNVMTMKKMDIQPRPIVLRGVHLIKSSP